MGAGNACGFLEGAIGKGLDSWRGSVWRGGEGVTRWAGVGTRSAGASRLTPNGWRGVVDGRVIGLSFWVVSREAPAERDSKWCQMIVGYHVIFSTYGFWLPNDPRGSWSDFVGSWDLFRYGPATKTDERCSLAYRDHDRNLRLAAKAALKYPPVRLTGVQARAVGDGFGGYVARSGLAIWACAILPDHVHLVMGRPEMAVEQVVIQLKGAATQELVRQGIHPLAGYRGSDGRVPKCFAQGQWKVYLDPPDVMRAIEYVEKNPVKERLPAQRWRFVTGWG